jgi:hypothetical protein
VWQAVQAAMKGDKPLAYSDVQKIIRAAFDYGIVTVQEREDLRMASDMFEMDTRASRALKNFIGHVDRLSKPADALAARTGDKQQGMRLAIPDPGPFTRVRTNLGKFSHGMFDVAYDPDEGELNVTLKVKYAFQEGITPADQTYFKSRFKEAVRNWDKAKVTFETSGFTLNPVILLRFLYREVSSGQHFVVDVQKNERRSFVAVDINVWKGISFRTMTHELGHVFGNYDEYGGSGLMGWIERRMYWHDNGHLDDPDGVMSSGDKFRARYFDHFLRYVNENFARFGVKYETKLG